MHCWNQRFLEINTVLKRNLSWAKTATKKIKAKTKIKKKWKEEKIETN